VTSKPRCKKCKSTQIYIRRVSNETVCRTCGSVEKIKKYEVKKSKRGKINNGNKYWGV